MEDSPLCTSRKARGTAVVVAALAVLAFCSQSLAQAEADALTEAIKLYDEGDYLSAQEALLEIDRAKLSEEQQQKRDEYVNRVQVALIMTEKAVRDLEDADFALAAGESTKARFLLESVLDNTYATAAQREMAQAKLKEIAPKTAPRPAGKPAGTMKPVETRQPSPPAQPAAPTTPQDKPPAAKEPPQSPQPRPMRPSEAPRTMAPPASKPANATAQPSMTDAERARVLSQEGDELVRTGRYGEAARKYEEALALVPGYPAATEGLEQISEHERNIYGSRSMDLAERIRMQDRINWQRTETEFRNAEKNIRQFVADDQYEQAKQWLVTARQVLETGKQYADPVSQYDVLRGELDALETWVANEERRYHEITTEQQRLEIERERARRTEEFETTRQRQVDSLMKQAHQHKKDGDLESAVKVLEQVTRIDPGYDPARWLLDEWEERWMYEKQQSRRAIHRIESQRVLDDVEDSKIPWSDEVRYPKDWLERISRPERDQGNGRRDSLLFSALDDPIRVDFNGDPLNQVIQRFADARDINILVNWADLRNANVDVDAPVYLDLPHEITLRKALTEALDQAGSGRTELGFAVRDGVINVATQAKLDRETYTAVYDITDLLMDIPSFTDSPTTDLAANVERAARAQAQRSTFANKPWATDESDDVEAGYDHRTRDQVDKLIHLIQESVQPDSWVDHGGAYGVIDEINGQLVVTQNSGGQAAVGDLLGKLREKRAIQVAVEARFLTVSSNYLEELGMDVDIVLNQGNAGFDFVPTGLSTNPTVTDPVLGNSLLLPRSFSRLGFTPAVPALGTANTGQGGGALTVPAQPFLNPVFVPPTDGSANNLTPVPITNNVLNFTNPQALQSDVSGSFLGRDIGPAFSLFGSFLDNIQVDFLIRATQADQRTSVLTAPRLVLFNGQRSWVAVTIQRNYVASLTPTVAVAAAAAAPVTGTVSAGAVLDVQATVTADKRYVNMTLRPGVTRLINLERFQVTAGGTAGSTFVQLPELSVQLIQTTVSVPDGGTLLIGGQKLANEIEIEAGVPILSKIPILKRAYNSRTMAKDEQTLLILVKPKIFIQSEQEELAFPSYSQR